MMTHQEDLSTRSSGSCKKVEDAVPQLNEKLHIDFIGYFICAGWMYFARFFPAYVGWC